MSQNNLASVASADTITQTEDNPTTAACRAELDAALATDADTLALLCRTRTEAEAELTGKGKGALEAEFAAYAGCAEKLTQHYTAARDAFVDNHAAYRQMFTKIELLNQLAQFDFLGANPGDPTQTNWFWDGVMGTPGDVTGAVLSIGGALFSAVSYMRMRGLTSAADDVAGGAARTVANISDDAARVARMAKVSRAMAIGGGVFSVAMATFTIISAVKEENEKVEALRNGIADYADWYAQTRENALLFCYWSKTMRAEIRELISNFSENPDEITDEAFIDKLDGYMITAGELDAQIRLATRMMCDGLSDEQAANYTDLDARIITHIRGQLNAPGSTVCAEVARR